MVAPLRVSCLSLKPSVLLPFVFLLTNPVQMVGLLAYGVQLSRMGCNLTDGQLV